jgi:hypothetical protein
MIIPNMEKMPHTFKVEHDGVRHAIYVTSDNVTYINYPKSGYVARNCHTTAQSTSGRITFADLVRRDHHRPQHLYN